MSEEAPPTSAQLPTLTFEKITFSDDTDIKISKGDIVVFVGPNNAGKSAALRELYSWTVRPSRGRTIKSAVMAKEGNAETFQRFLEENSQKYVQNGNTMYGGLGFQIHQTNLSYYDRFPDDRFNYGELSAFFSERLPTEGRLNGSDPAGPVHLYKEPPKHPIHSMLQDQKLSADISTKFRHAFGEDLTIYRAAGSSFPLFVGQKPEISEGLDELSYEFTRALESTNSPLQHQGDGMRGFATVLLGNEVRPTQSLVFLDEPEAFLHPPQARLLGRYIAESRRSDSQVFIATHSSDILEGLLGVEGASVKVVRIRREEDINRAREVSSEQTRSIVDDPLARYSGVFNGIFFEHVIICESDADCMFYQAILNVPSVSGERRPDVLFVHASGKHRMAKIARTLRALDVPVSIIVDIDVIREKTVLRGLSDALGGDWSRFEPDWRPIVDEVNSRKRPLNAAQVSAMIADQIAGVTDLREFPSDRERKIKEVFKTASVWGDLKQSGRNALPGGDAIKHFDSLCRTSAESGLWIVQVGELEGFCRSVGWHGPQFVERVLETKNIAVDSELAAARDFVQNVWRRALEKPSTSSAPSENSSGNLQ